MSVKALRSRIAAIDLEEVAPYLILGRKSQNNIVAGTYPIDDLMQTELADIAQSALDRIDELEMSVYEGPTAIVAGEEGKWVTADHLNAESRMLQLLASPDEIDDLPVKEISDRSLSFYVIAIGSDENDRVFFVRKQARTFKAQRKLLAILGKQLTPVRRNILSLDRYIDFILMKEGAVVFNMQAFEGYIQDPEDIAKALEDDLEALHETLPLDAETRASLKETGVRGSLLRRHVRSIVESEYLEDLTIDKVKRALRAVDRDPRDFVANGRLKFERSNSSFFLKFLNQSVWKAPFNGKTYSTNAKHTEE